MTEVNREWPDWFKPKKKMMAQYNCGDANLESTTHDEQQQKTTSGSTSVSQEQKTEAAASTGSSRLDV